MKLEVKSLPKNTNKFILFKTWKSLNLVKQTLWQREIAKPISKSVLKYGKHPSVTAIRNLNIRSIFEFAFASLTSFLKEIKKLNPRRVAQSTDVPVKIERMLIYFNANYICRFLNWIFKLLRISNHFKACKRYTYLWKRFSWFQRKLVKDFWKVIMQKLTIFANQNLSKYLCGFRKGFSTQYFVLAMLERWKSAVVNRKLFVANLTDISKAFDCLSHELIIAKLNAHGFSLPVLKLIHDYLSNR